MIAFLDDDDDDDDVDVGISQSWTEDEEDLGDELCHCGKLPPTSSDRKVFLYYFTSPKIEFAHPSNITASAGRKTCNMPQVVTFIPCQWACLDFQWKRVATQKKYAGA